MPERGPRSDSTAPLAAREQAWLDSHLAACVACRAIAEMYAKDSAALRTQRDAMPEPPRDLWARTAARIERESAARRTAMRRAGSRQGPSLPILGAVSGLAVVALVVVATAVSGGFLSGVGQQAASSPAIALASQAIPLKAALEVDAGTVTWLGASEDGAFAYNVADIDVVCPHDRQPDCAPFEDGHARRVTLTATPQFVFQSPVDYQAVVVGTDSTGADAIIVVPLPTPDPTPDVRRPRRATEAVPGSSLEPAASSIELSPTPSVLISATSTLVPIESADASGLPDGSDAASAEPTPATAVAIITNVTVVGRTAAYSPDGAWFAFSARPADGSTGPDIYVWHVGDLLARPLTGDHASVFASWVGGSLLGSRVGPAAAILPETGSPEPSAPDGETAPDPTIEIPPPVDFPAARDLGQVVPPAQPSSDITLAVISTAETLPQTFLVDPATGAEIDLLDAEWQPAVDPTGLAVVAWQGTVGIAGDGLTAAPATGNLVLHPFHGPTESEEPLASQEACAVPRADAEPLAAAQPRTIRVAPSASASPEVVRDFPPQIVAPDRSPTSTPAGTRPGRGWPSGSPTRSIRPGAPEPAPLRSVHGSAGSTGGRPTGRHGAAGVLDRARPAGLGEPARTGRRREPDPDRGLDRRRGRRDREHPGDRRHRRPIAGRDGGAPCVRCSQTGRSRRTGPCDIGVQVSSGVSSRSRAAKQVGRRVGAHRRPRPGRATGSRWFKGPQPDRATPGKRIPAALDLSEQRAVDDPDRSARRRPRIGRGAHR